MRTSLYSILCIVIRLGAVFLAFKTLGSVLSVVASWGNAVNMPELWLSIGFTALTLLIAFLFWLYPGPLARLAAGSSSQQVFESPISAPQIQWIALSVLGMYFVLTGFAGLSYFGIRRMLISAVVDQEQNNRERIVDAFYWAVQIGLGAALSLGARGLVGVFHRLRYGDALQSPDFPPQSRE
ncbi:hypothetical protein [Dokdonella soli]|uniref:DUF1206 domain-containing protein n=1 Tax=Dokdonella soli TaxID=529810 RepID=A0ABN1ILG0_9GAMM